jgi:hypothetical protein
MEWLIFGDLRHPQSGGEQASFCQKKGRKNSGHPKDALVHGKIE